MKDTSPQHPTDALKPAEFHLSFSAIRNAYKRYIDSSRIDITQESDLRYWCQRFDVTSDELKNTIERVGPLVGDVKRELRI